MRLRTFASSAFLVVLAACQAETFTSTGPAGLEVIHGPPELVSLGTELDTLLQLRVVNEAGDPLTGVAVQWRLIDGDGELIPVDTLSGVDGLVMARWKFRYVPGLQRAQVQVAGLDPVTFTTEARGFRAVQVTAGYHFGCGVDASAQAWCWGGDHYEIGDPSQPEFSIRPTRVSGGHLFVNVQAADAAACGLTPVGEVWCWGHNWLGALFGPSGGAGTATPVRITGLPPMQRIRLGQMHGCGIGTDSTTWCWGNNSSGQSGGIGPSVGATQVVTSLRFVDVAPGMDQTCGLTATGVAYCWGSNGLRQLGDSGVSRNAPTTPVLGGHQFAEIGSGDNNSCGRTVSGEVWCWGDDLLYDRILRDGPVRFDLPTARSLSVAFNLIAVGTMGGNVSFLAGGGRHETLGPELTGLGVRQLAGRGGFCFISRTGDVYCSGTIVDVVFCSVLPPEGCAPTGPIPLPSGGRVYGYPPFGD